MPAGIAAVSEIQRRMTRLRVGVMVPEALLCFVGALAGLVSPRPTPGGPRSPEPIRRGTRQYYACASQQLVEGSLSSSTAPPLMHAI